MRSPVELGRSMLPRSPAQRLKLERDILEEIQFHLDCRTEANRQCGMSREEASTAARVQFGDPEVILDECVAAHEGQPARQFSRLLARVFPLGIACGFAAAVLLVLYALVVRLPATYPPEGRWFVVWWEYLPTGILTADSSIDQFETWRQESQTAEYVGLGAYRPCVSRFEDRVERLMGKYVAYDYLKAHSIRPVVGRMFGSEARENTLRPVVISHDLWKRRFDRGTNVLGSKLDVDGKEHTIVGVTPREYQTYYPFDFFAPIDFTDRDRTTRRYLVSARLKHGVSPEEAQAEFESLVRRHGEPGWRVRLRRPQDVYGGDYPRKLVPYAALALMLLVLAVVRTRVSDWRREGSGFAGSLVGIGIVGTMTAFATIKLLRSTVLAGVDQRFNFVADPPIILGFLSLTLLAAAATESWRRRGSDKPKPAAGLPRRFSPALIVTTVLAFLMLVSAVTLTHDWWERRSPQVGFDADSVFTVGLLMPPADFPDRAARRSFFKDVIAKLDSTESIVQYSFTHGFPTITESQGASIMLPTSNTPGEMRWARIATRAVGLDYFETVGMQTLTGIPFHSDSADGSIGLAVISKAMADRYWPGENPIGKRLEIYSVGWPFEITAVVENAVSTVPGDEKMPILYPLVWHWTRPQMIVVRTHRDFVEVAGQIARVVANVNPAARLGEMHPGNEALVEAGRRRAATVIMLWSSALLAIILSASLTLRSVRGLTDRNIRSITFRRSIDGSGRAALHGVYTAVALSLVVGGLLSPTVSSLLITEMSLESQLGALCIVVPTFILAVIHLGVAYRPLRQLERVTKSSSGPR